MSQFALPLPHIPAFTEENFFVSASNEAAWRLIQAWPSWPAHALLLVGTRGSGKSHLSHIWAEKSGASIVNAEDLSDPSPGHWLVENIEHTSHYRQLLHLFNYCKETNHTLLMTSCLPAEQLRIPLPDLSSRLLATPLVMIEAADEAVLAAAMRKQFADRQLKVEEDVIAYLLLRSERSLAYIQDLVLRIDQAALEKRRNITVPFVRKLLEI